MKKTAQPGALRANRTITLARTKRQRERRREMMELNKAAMRGFYPLLHPQLMKPSEVEFYKSLLERHARADALRRAQRAERVRPARQQQEFVEALPREPGKPGLFRRMLGSWRKWQ